jgi:signal transduction histidine kinase
MGWQATILVTPTLAALAIALFLSGYAGLEYWNGQRDAVVVLFFWTTVATIVWTGFSALKLLQTDPEVKLLFFRLLHLGAAALPPLLFCFVVAYTDRTRWLKSTVIGGVFAFPLLFIALLFVNPGQLVLGEMELTRAGLVVLRVGDGPMFLLFLFYSTVLVAASIGLLLFESRRIGSTYYPQAALISVALVVPIVFGLLTAIGVPPFSDDRINLVPTSAAVSTTTLGILLGRYRLFELPPLAYTVAMKHGPDGVVVLDRTEQIVHANERGTELLDRLGAQAGDVLTHQLPDLDPDTASGGLVELPTRNEEPAYYRLFTEPLRRGGRRVGWVVAFRDETTQQQQQRQLQRQNERLEEFSSVVSHDLRNPLNVAEGRLELLREETDSEHAEPIENALTRMDTLIENLLQLAREGKEVTETEAVGLGELAMHCWQNVETADATIRTSVDQPIYADRTRLQQLLENLIRNAVEHGGGAVSVTIGVLDDGFYLEDDGSGIATSDPEAVFEAGYSTLDGGTGFGLNIGKQIVDAHGWEILVTEGSEGGARFEVTGVEFAE